MWLTDAGCFSTWFPDVRLLCANVQAAIRQAQVEKPGAEAVRPPINGVPWTACTCNLGPRTVCLSHRDTQDLAYSVSGMWIYGAFNGSNGGQLILHEPKLVIRLYPGDFFLFPSACITHGNLPLPPGETRRSLVFYMSAGLLRYVNQGLQTRGEWVSTPAGLEASVTHDQQAEQRWSAGWALFSTLEDVRRRNKLSVTPDVPP